MRKIRILIIALLCSSQVFAADPALMRQCLVDICGTEKSYLAMQADGDFGNLVSEEDKAFFKEADPVLNRIFENVKKSSRLKVAMGKELEQNLANVEFSPAHIAIIAAAVTFSRLGMISTDEQNQLFESSTHGLGIKLKADQLARYMTDVSPETLTKMVNIVNAYIESPEAGASNSISGLNYQTLKLSGSQRTFSSGNETREELWKKFIREWKTRIATIQATFGSYGLIDFDISVLDKILNDQPLTEAEEDMTISLISRSYGILAVQSEAVAEAVRSNKMELKELIKLTHWEERNARVQGILIDKKAWKNQKDLALDACHKNIVKATASAPSGLRLRKARQLLEFVKATASQTASKYFSGSDLEVARKSIRESTFEAPKGLETVREKVLTTLVRRQSQFREENNRLKLLSGVDLASMFVNLVGIGDDDGAKLVSKGLQSVCNSFQPPFFQDQAFRSAGVIQVGWQSVLFPRIGAGVLAHEIGHVVSGAIELNQTAAVPGKSPVSERAGYADARICSSTAHMIVETTVKDKWQFEEEDWADTFASSVLKDMQASWPYGANFGCALVNLDEKLKFSDLNLANTNPLLQNDGHSNGFFRALKIHSNLGMQLPQSCDAALKKTESLIMSLSCAK